MIIILAAIVLGWILGYVFALTASIPKSKRRDYKSNAYCEKCLKETQHVFHDAGHERDSSGDYKRCTECGNYIFS